MTTVATISAAAFNGVAASISGVVQVATMTYNTRGAYNTATGAYALTPTTLTGGRAVIGTQAAIASAFPGYATGPDDTLIYLEGFTSVPDVGWTVTVNSVARTIKAIGDIAGAGTFFEVVAA